MQGEYNWYLMRDLFGDGIFAVDGDKWRHQRKLASYEFSTKVLRDFSTAVFRANSAKLTSKISEAAAGKQTIELQVFYYCSSMLNGVLVKNWDSVFLESDCKNTLRVTTSVHISYN